MWNILKRFSGEYNKFFIQYWLLLVTFVTPIHRVRNKMCKSSVNFNGFLSYDVAVNITDNK